MISKYFLENLQHGLVFSIIVLLSCKFSSVYAGGYTDIGVAEIIFDDTIYGGGIYTIPVSIENYGDVSVTDFNVSFFIDGGVVKR